MKFLIIETSGEEAFVALCLQKNWQKVPLPPRNQMQHLLPAVDTLLNANGLKLEDLDFLAVGNGPGTFTGTRIGVLTAKTLSFAKGLPLIPFCSLTRFTPRENPLFHLILDAKSHGFYVYDGQTLSQTLPKTFHPLFLSPHPHQIETRLSLTPSLATLNLPFLIHHLEDQFTQGKTVHPHALKVSYLHTP